jgi:hypothetical protein
MKYSTFRVLLSLFTIAFLFSCNKADRPSSLSDISNQTFTNGLRIDGHEYDSLIIENCVFKEKTLQIGNVDFVTIKNCTFENIKGNGIMVGFIGPTSNISIEDCDFKTISYNGVDSHERALDCIIKGCTFTDIALSQVGASMGQPHHGIYWKGKNVSILNNTFNCEDQPFGNGISVRSSGLVSGNIVSNAPKNGIMYYANHPGSDSLIIENNFLINNTFYSIICGSDGNTSNHNENVLIRFNSMVQTTEESIYISGDFEGTTNIEIYGNIMVNSTGSYFKTFYTLNSIHTNLKSTSDIGFVNMSEGDLHILNSSEANGYCDSLSLFPALDIDGEVRIQNNLDAGADEIN